jgi:hypothetical protein
MKNVLAIIAAGLVFLSCNQNDAQSTAVQSSNTAAQAPSNDAASFTSIQWIDSIQQDLGTIKEGQTPEISWRFKNTGDKPLVIENASASCGCTVAEKPQEPILPGEEGAIKAKFTSTGRTGPNNKQVIVYANTAERQHSLGFTVIVEK